MVKYIPITTTSQPTIGHSNIETIEVPDEVSVYIENDYIKDIYRFEVRFHLHGSSWSIPVHIPAEALSTLPEQGIIAIVADNAIQHGIVCFDYYHKEVLAQSLYSDVENILNIKKIADMSSTSINTNIAKIARQLPGMTQSAYCPVKKCGERAPTVLYYLIQHLNDSHKWTREKIADWLDEKMDAGEIDIEFSQWEDKC